MLGTLFGKQNIVPQFKYSWKKVDIFSILLGLSSFGCPGWFGSLRISDNAHNLWMYYTIKRIITYSKIVIALHW